MQIKQRLRINNVVLTLAAIAACAVLLMTAQRVGRAMTQNRLADELITASFERLVLRTDYVRTGSERAREQWIAKHRQIDGLLKSATETFPAPGDRQTIAALTEGHESIAKIFQALSENKRKSGANGLSSALTGEVEDRLLAQLNMRVYEVVLLGGKLQQTSNAAFASALETGAWSIGLVFLFLGAVTVINSFTMNRTIADRIGRLGHGAAAIGRGDLAYRIDLPGDDEFTGLAGSFNDMAMKLSGTYHELEQEIHERKDAESALRESEEKYRNLFMNMTEEVHFWELIRDSEGRIKTWRLVDANPPTLKTWGRNTIDEIIGKTTDEIFGPGAAEHYLPIVQKIMTEGVPYYFEDYFPHLDKYFRFTSVPLKDHFITTGSDITGIKKAELALRESEKRFRLALHNAPVSVAVQDRELRYIWAYNQRTARPEEIIGKRDEDIFTREEAALVTANKRRVIEENIELREGMWFDRPGGRIFLDIYWEPVHDAEGKVIGVGSATVDLTPMKQAEEALRESEERYRTLFENLNVAALLIEPIFDGDGRLADLRYLMANSAVQKHLNKTREEMEGKLYSEVFHYKGRNPVFDAYERVLQSGEPFKGEFLLPALGRYYDLSAYRPVPGRLALILSDITERRKAEDAIKASLSEKEVLLKEIHHRVKNNLQVISSLVGMQCDVSKDETVRETLSDVTDRVRSMALVHEKLYQSESLARIDFAEYARSLLSYLWRAHGAVTADVRLTLDLEPVSLSVETAVPCGLLLNELAGNTLKHAFRGRSNGEVTVALKGKSDGHIVLSVRDNGVGLPPGFDWRQSKSLGLRLVRMLAGQIDATVKASGNEGTRFEIAFMNSAV